VIRVVVDDLASVPADAVVRPTTAALEPLTPELRRLEKVGGPAFWKQLHVEKPLEVGVAVVTGAGDLAAEFVIHAVIQSAEEPVSRDGVRHVLRSVVQRAIDWQLATLTMPLMGTGPGGLSHEDAAGLMVDALAGDLRHATYPTDVCIVVETEEDREVVEALIRSRGAE
jgi:O-acetyl-ADP-ribose deacetylase (regulator of RNase III)